MSNATQVRINAMKRVGVSREQTTDDAKKRNLFRIGHILNTVDHLRLCILANCLAPNELDEVSITAAYVVQLLERESGVLVAVILSDLIKWHQPDAAKQWDDLPKLIEV
ncbi:MAG: hypothetical protein ISS71_04770 [Phycisphaerae bacterium]|nr:hypothetical protein [Phycisphaerae bacterium]